MGRGEQGLRERVREGERGRRRVRQVRTCALAIWPARSACPIVRRRRRERSQPLPALITPSCQNAPRGRKISLTWTHFSSHGRYLESRTTGLHSFRTGGARLGQRSGTPPTIFSVDDVAASAWRLAVAKPAASCFSHRCGVRWTQDMILGSTEAECA